MEKNSDTYVQRLQKWNNSEKYTAEVDFLELLLKPEKDENILDYGCGTGFCLELLKQRTRANYFGYDVNVFFDKNKIPDWFKYKIDRDIKFDKVYFMHSFAHIEKINELLQNIKFSLNDKGLLYVITPNKEFDEYYRRIKDENYSPDLTVVSHYSVGDIKTLFETYGYNIEIIGQFGKKVSYFHERIFLIASSK